MKEVRVLFGFDVPEFQLEVEEYLESMGYVVCSELRLTKAAIKQYLSENKCDCAVLLEVLNYRGKAEKYTADELALLTDERDLNIIIVLNDNLRGTDYMKTLYAAGITSAVYQRGRKGGATYKDIGTLIINKRSRRDARDYYGIPERQMPMRVISSDVLVDSYEMLLSDACGGTMIERFIECCRRLSQKQVGALIQRLPGEIRDELILFEEFHIIVEMLQSFGIDLKIRRPKKLMIGLFSPASVREKPRITEKEKKAPVMEGKTDHDAIIYDKRFQEDENMEIKKEVFAETENVKNMSDPMEDLLRRCFDTTGIEQDVTTMSSEQMTDNLAKLFGEDDFRSEDGESHDCDKYVTDTVESSEEVAGVDDEIFDSEDLSKSDYAGIGADEKEDLETIQRGTLNSHEKRKKSNKRKRGKNSVMKMLPIILCGGICVVCIFFISVFLISSKQQNLPDTMEENSYDADNLLLDDNGGLIYTDEVPSEEQGN